MAQPPLVIDPLSPLAVPPGLFGVATGLDLPDHGANAGMIWVPDTCGVGEKYAAPCATPPYPAFAADAMEKLAQAWPFIVYATVNVGAAGWTEQEIERRARQRLINTEQVVAETALWGTSALTIFQNVVPVVAGTVPPAAAASPGVTGGIFQQLAAGGAAAGFVDLTAETALTVPDAVAALEQAAADNYYGQAIIHARPRIAAYAGKGNQFRVIGLPPESQRTYQYTQNWNVWNFGNGYAGTGPTGQAPTLTPGDGTGTEYMWATGRIIVWRSPDAFYVPSAQVFDRQLNQRIAYAFRQYVVGVECFSACVKVTRA